MKKLIQTWKLACEDSLNGELTYRQWGAHDRKHLEHGWWVDPKNWGLGISAMNDWTYGRITIAVELGPFSWGLSLVKANAS